MIDDRRLISLVGPLVRTEDHLGVGVGRDGRRWEFAAHWFARDDPRPVSACQVVDVAADGLSVGRHVHVFPLKVISLYHIEA